jgi:hypothetical protein
MRAELEHQKKRSMLRASFVRTWRGLKPKGAISLFFDPRNPVRAFEELLVHEDVQ